jgi:hypothetical protein
LIYFDWFTLIDLFWLIYFDWFILIDLLYFYLL